MKRASQGQMRGEKAKKPKNQKVKRRSFSLSPSNRERVGDRGLLSTNSGKGKTKPQCRVPLEMHHGGGRSFSLSAFQNFAPDRVRRTRNAGIVIANRLLALPRELVVRQFKILLHIRFQVGFHLPLIL